MSKKRKKNSLNDMKSLDASSFLKRYYGISHEEIAGMTHDTIKSFFPQLRRTSFDCIQKNPELVSTGKIILVEDAKHYQVPYITPTDVSTLDPTLGCDTREIIIQRIVEFLETSVQKNLNALLVIEGDDSLEEYAFQPQILSDSILEESELLSYMQRAVEKDAGIIIKKDYSLEGYRMLSHGDNYYSTMVLPPLQRQSVGISKKTDAICVLYENGILGIVMNGVLEEISSKEELQKKLMTFFPVPKKKEKVKEEDTNISSPSAYTLGEMSVYELEKLMKVYKASNQIAYYHVIRRELIRRTRSSKEYRFAKAKQKMLIDGVDYND